MSPIQETLYPSNIGRSYENGQDLTPYSAVSSFNLPQSCDSTLITPISLTQSLTVTTSSLLGNDMELKLSPSDSNSPSYDMFDIEDEFDESKYNPPMKYKHPHSALHISTTDSSFPPSPLVPSTPYWGSYGVSATPISSTSESSPRMNPSPIGAMLHSLGRIPTSAQSYRSHASVPMLIAPSPGTRHAPPSHSSSTYRQNSLQSVSTTASSASSNLPQYPPQPQPRVAMPIRRRRKSPKHARDADILLTGQMNFDEQVLMRLTEVDRLPWKEVVVKFREETGKSMKVPALQMRKKRLVERLRVWTPSDERALSLAFQDQGKVRWDQIASAMMKHGCTERWSKESVQKKWHQMNPEAEHDNFIDEFEISPKDQHDLEGNNDLTENGTGNGNDEEYTLDDWSDNVNYSHHGLPGVSGGESASVPVSAVSVLSSNTEDAGRSRHASDASSHQLQQAMMYEIYRPHH